MTSGPSAATLTLLEKLAVDNGFDRELPREGEWLVFASTKSPLRIWLSAPGEELFLAAFSQSNVAAALDIGTTANPILPTGAAAARIVTGLPALHRLVRRAFQLSKTLPHELLHAFEKQTATLPRSTEAERFLVQRVGQDISLPTAELGLQIALIVALSSLRLGIRIPLSGHALLVAWFLFRRLWLRNVPPRQSHLEVWIAAGVLAAVAWPKLFWWDDPVTLLTGIGAAALLATINGWVGLHCAR